MTLTDAEKKVITEKIVQETVVKDDKLTRESFINIKIDAQNFLDVYKNISLY